MFLPDKAQMAGMLLAVSLTTTGIRPATAAVSIRGQVEAGGGPVASSTITLWAASAIEPRQLARTMTADDGRFELEADAPPDSGVTYYLVARGGVAAVNKGAGDNASLAFLTALGGKPPATVTMDEMTTVASVWTHAQFLDGDIVKGPRRASTSPRAMSRISSIFRQGPGGRPSPMP